VLPSAGGDLGVDFACGKLVEPSTLRAFLDLPQGGDEIVTYRTVLLLLVLTQGFPDEFAQGMNRRSTEPKS
jgi:hypothetical protein